MKFNHICLLAGIFFLLLGFTVFAQATSIDFDCANSSSCSMKEYCRPDGYKALLVNNGVCYSFSGDYDGADVISQPCAYPFSSSTTGEHTCAVTIKTTGYGNATGQALQSDEVTSVYINGSLIGTTLDKYANPGQPLNTTFCGIDTQTLRGKVVLSADNSISFSAKASHGIVSVSVNCVLGNGNPKDCSTDLAPIIEDLPDKSLKYYESFTIDLWDYINDYDDSIADIIIDGKVDGNSIVCSLESGRYAHCAATRNLGVSSITVRATDSCGKVDTKSFSVNVSNSPPTLSLPDVEKSCVDNLDYLFDLRNYSWDDALSSRRFQVISDSNSSLVTCNVQDTYFLSCRVNSCSESCANIGVRVTDEFGLYYDDIFKICFGNSAPVWEQIPLQCINSSQYRFIDLTDFAYDAEDGNNLVFSLEQSNSSAVNCVIEDSNFISCSGLNNKHLSNVLTIKATDSAGKYSTTQTTISTNCFDTNTPDNNRIIFEADNKGVCLEQCTSYGTQMKLSNFSGERKCFNFDAESTPYDLLNVSVSNGELCLNDGETTYFTLNANTCGAEQRAYQVRVFAEDTNIELWFDFQVGSCSNFDGFSINEFDGKICKGEEKNLTVMVRNTTMEQKRVYLSADNAMILPYFEKDYVNLSSGEQKAVQLVINAKSLDTGYYNILLSGDAGSYHINKRLEIEVVDCSEIAERTFSLSVPSVCFDVSRGQKFESSFTITRQSCICSECYRNEKEFFLKLLGMPAELSYNSVLLNPNQGKSINYTVFVPQNAPAGHQLLTIAGYDGTEWNSFTEQKLLCLNVLGESKASLIVKTQAKDIVWCGSQIFELELTNNGDFDANYSLSATDTPTGVSISFSESTVNVPKGQSRVIYAVISTNPSAQIRDNQWLKILVKGPVELSAKVYFNVKEKSSFDDLEILSATKQVIMKGNSTASYDIVLRNNTGASVKNVLVSFEDVPNDVNIDSVVIGEILPGGVATVSGIISAGNVDGNFEPVFVVSSGQLINKQTFSLVIEENSLGFGTGMFAGLFGFGAISLIEGLFGSLLLAVLLITLVAVIIYGVTRNTKPSKKEAWLE
ncbi:MAG: hypothetical protein WC462_04615 [archaeon]